MISVFSDVQFRLHLRPQSLVRTLIGLGCLRVSLALITGSHLFGGSLAATAAQWISCAASLILLALWDWGVQERHPGISSLLRKCSCGAIAGSLLPCAASLLSFRDLGAPPALAAALAGLALTLFSALPLEWLLRDIDLDLPPLGESVVMARLAALQEIVKRSALGAGGSGAASACLPLAPVSY
jgi:hypothetical protein